MLTADDGAADGGKISRSGNGLDGKATTPGLGWLKDFPGDQREVRAVRRWLASLLPDCPARDDVVIVASELATNAIRHTASGSGGRFRVEIIRYSTVVRIAVADEGAPHGPQLIDDPAGSGEHGRGLLVVARLSARCGSLGDENGRIVWADVPWNSPAPAPEPNHDDLTQADDGSMALARWFGVQVWFGQHTRQWWTMVDDTLVSASSTQELASKLARLTMRQARPQRLGHQPSAERSAQMTDWAGWPGDLQC